MGGKDAQSKVSCPISIGEPVQGNVVKFTRKEIREMLRSDQEWSGGATQQTGTHFRTWKIANLHM